MCTIIIAAKVYCSLCFIGRNLHACIENMKTLSFCSLVNLALAFCSAAWDLHISELINKFYNLTKSEQQSLYKKVATADVVALVNCLSLE